MSETPQCLRCHDRYWRNNHPLADVIFVSGRHSAGIANTTYARNSRLNLSADVDILSSKAAANPY